MKLSHVVLCLLGMLASGCAHQVTFDHPEHYVVTGSRQNASVTTVIDAQTLAMKVTINSIMTGAAHEWVVEPGDMLKQVADIELPQLFSHYEFSTTYKEPSGSARPIVVQLAIPSYKFEEFHAKFAVNAKVYGPNRRPLLDKTYAAEGDTEGAKMFWGGAFAMKSAIRQSSLDALKKIFEQLRADLTAVLSK